MTNGISLGTGKAIRKSTTGLALLVQLANEKTARWIPTSQFHDDSEVFLPGHEGTVVVLEWWADKEGLSDSRQQTKG